MLTEAELAAAMRISARQVQRRAGGNPPDISASGAARDFESHRTLTSTPITSASVLQIEHFFHHSGCVLQSCK